MAGVQLPKINTTTKTSTGYIEGVRSGERNDLKNKDWKKQQAKVSPRDKVPPSANEEIARYLYLDKKNKKTKPLTEKSDKPYAQA